MEELKSNLDADLEVMKFRIISVKYLTDWLTHTYHKAINPHMCGAMGVKQEGKWYRGDFLGEMGRI